MLNKYELVNKFLKNKNLYDLVLWDKLSDWYLFDIEELNLITQMEQRGMLWVGVLRSNMVPLKERIEEYPARLSGVFIENIKREDNINE